MNAMQQAGRPPEPPSPEVIQASLRFYMLMLMHKLAPDGVVLTEEEIERFTASPRNHLMIYRHGDSIVVKMMEEHEAPLLFATPGGSA